MFLLITNFSGAGSYNECKALHAKNEDLKNECDIIVVAWLDGLVSHQMRWKSHELNKTAALMP